MESPTQIPRLPLEIIIEILQHAAPVLRRSRSSPGSAQSYTSKRKVFIRLSLVNHEWYYAIQPAILTEVVLLGGTINTLKVLTTIERRPAYVRCLVIHCCDFKIGKSYQIPNPNSLRKLVWRFFELCPRLRRTEWYGWERFASGVVDIFKGWSDEPPPPQPKAIRSFLCNAPNVPTCRITEVLEHLEDSLESLEVHCWIPIDANETRATFPERVPRLQKILLFKGSPTVPKLQALIDTTYHAPPGGESAFSLRTLELYRIQSISSSDILGILKSRGLGTYLTTLHLTVAKLLPEQVSIDFFREVFNSCPSLISFRSHNRIPMKAFTYLPLSLRHVTMCIRPAGDKGPGTAEFTQLVQRGRFEDLESIEILIHPSHLSVWEDYIAELSCVPLIELTTFKE